MARKTTPAMIANKLAARLLEACMVSSAALRAYGLIEDGSQHAIQLQKYQRAPISLLEITRRPA